MKESLRTEPEVKDKIQGFKKTLTDLDRMQVMSQVVRFYKSMRTNSTKNAIKTRL